MDIWIKDHSGKWDEQCIASYIVPSFKTAIEMYKILHPGVEIEDVEGKYWLGDYELFEKENY